jgi:hypothetical protein
MLDVGVRAAVRGSGYRRVRDSPCGKVLAIRDDRISVEGRVGLPVDTCLPPFIVTRSDIIE